MNSNVISEDTRVNLEFYNKKGDKIGGTYFGMFDQIQGEMEVVVRFGVAQAPLPSVFLESERVSAVFHHDLHGQLKFTGQIINKTQTNFGTNFLIRIDDDFKNIQKREYYRPVCSLNAKYRVANAKATEAFKPARVRNISYTGVCVLTEKSEEISTGDLLDLFVFLSSRNQIKLGCRVIRLNIVETSEKLYYDLGLEIEHIQKQNEKQLIQFLTRSSMVRSLYWGESRFD